MPDIDKRARAAAILSEWLQGNFMSRFSIGDTFDLYFDTCCLVCQDVISEDEKFLTQWLQHHYCAFSTCTDKENISKATILAAHLRKEVTGVMLDQACNLTLCFEDDSKLVLPTNVDIVDWQWALTKAGTDPYEDYIVACFWASEIELAETV